MKEDTIEAAIRRLVASVRDQAVMIGKPPSRATWYVHGCDVGIPGTDTTVYIRATWNGDHFRLDRITETEYRKAIQGCEPVPPPGGAK